VVGACTVLGTVFAGMQVFGTEPSTPTPPAVAIGEGAPAQQPVGQEGGPAKADTATGQPVAVGQCLLEDSPSACDDGHNGQVVSLGGTCDMGAFVRFAGGDPAREVIASSVSLRPSAASGTTVCAVRMTSPQWVSAQGILTTRRGDFARRCFHDTPREEVGCDVPHTREAVAVRTAGGTSDINCQAAATAYLGIDFQRFSAELTLERSMSSLGTTCWVKARGHNVLTESVRSVGTRSLPLRAMS
jgi:hypothetical protein